jgi:dienelactone hydrolase
VAIPKPTGPHAVGSITHELVDPSRPAHLATEALGRRLRVKAWYPAVRTAQRPELIWAEARRDPSAPLPMRLVLACIRARSATVPSAAMSPTIESAPLVIYNHGLISFAEENTSLMEELASHGFAVVAIQHADQLAELRALQSGRPAQDRRARSDLERRLRTASPRERAELGPKSYAEAVGTGRIVGGRSADTSFVLTHASEVLGAIPGCNERSVDASKAHLVGFSIGGAVATVTAETDPRARSVVNLDGGLYGSSNACGLSVPYLMLYSSASDGINDDLLPAHADRGAAAGTRHLDFHDVAALLPVLRHLRATGAKNAVQFLAARNAAVRDFLTAVG